MKYFRSSNYFWVKSLYIYFRKKIYHVSFFTKTLKQ